jgi:hypothetical protein
MTKKYEQLVNLIEWDNWTHENSGKQWQISEVLHCRLDWLKEQISTNTIDKEEALSTIEMIQIFVEGIKDKDIKNKRSK